jgi:hypothetical protein
MPKTPRPALRHHLLEHPAQRRENPAIKADAHTRDQQIALTQLLAVSSAKPELLYTEATARREETWQKTIDKLAVTIVNSVSELVQEQKKDRDGFQIAIQQNSITIRNLSDILEGQIVKLNAVEEFQTGFMRKAETALQTIVTTNRNTTENSDHLLETVEAIRDRILTENTKIVPALTLVQDKLDDILQLLTKGISHEQTNLAFAVADSAYLELQPGTGAGSTDDSPG